MAAPFDANAMMAAIINAANAAAVAHAAAAAAAGPPPAVPRPFARLPGMQNNLPLDYMKPEDLKFFHKAVEGMDDKFDLKEEGLNSFMSKVKDRSDIYNWNVVISVPDSNATVRNVLSNYGQVTIDNCRAHVLTFVAVEGRDAQNDVMLYYFLVNSLTELAGTNALSQKSLYQNIVAGIVVPSGVMLLKVIIGKSSVDTPAKVLLLRQEVASLQYKMVEFKGDVRAFNLYAEQKRDQLLCRGQSVDEFIAHLFQAYMRVPDENFVRYVQSKKDKFEEDGSVTADDLMALALVKHDLIRQQIAAASEGEERIVALMATHDDGAVTSVGEARLVAMEASLRLMQDRLTRGQGGAPGGRARTNKKKDLAFAWKKIKPKESEPQVKVVNGRSYHWCRFHEAWTVHLPTDCTLGHAAAQPAAATAPTPAATQRGDYASAAHRALVSMMYEEDSA